MSSKKMKDSLDGIPAQTLLETLQVIDDENPNDVKIRAMKSIFLSSFDKKASIKDEELAYEMLQIAKNLSGSEILILRATYKVAQNKNTIDKINSITNRRAWAGYVAQQIGYNTPELVLRSEERLAGLFLIEHSDQLPNFNIPADTFTRRIKDSFRLTESGLKFCDFITRYE